MNQKLAGFYKQHHYSQEWGRGYLTYLDAQLYLTLFEVNSLSISV
jgi:hypothetical protein